MATEIRNSRRTRTSEWRRIVSVTFSTIAASLVLAATPCLSRAEEAPPSPPTGQAAATGKAPLAEGPSTLKEDEIAIDAIKKLVADYCAVVASDPSKDAIKEGPARMYALLLSKLPRTQDAKNAYYTGIGLKDNASCRAAFLSYFDRAELYVNPADLSQTRRFAEVPGDSTKAGEERTCRLPEDTPTKDGQLDARKCNDTLSGYEIAAVSHAHGRRCSVTRALAIKNGASAPVQNAIRRYYNDVAGDDCAARTSIDCTGISWCSGGVNRELRGLQGIITANLGTVMGRGFGYAQDSTAAANLSTYIGVRGFHAAGLVDLRGGLGLGMFPVPDSANPEMTGGATLTGGIGFYHGLLALNYLHTRRISDKLASYGNGIGIFIDAATIAKLVDRE
jgi:hypothetical protein